MATKKKSSSGSDPKSKRTVKNKMGKVMHEYKHHELESGGSGKPVKSRKQAIAIGLSEARKAGANIPKKGASKKSSSSKKSAAKKSTAKKSSTKKSSAKKSTSKKSASKKSSK
jgi:hypothetical protein